MAEILRMREGPSRQRLRSNAVSIGNVKYWEPSYRHELTGHVKPILIFADINGNVQEHFRNRCAFRLAVSPAPSTCARTLVEWMLEDGLGAPLGLQLHKMVWDPAVRGVWCLLAKYANFLPAALIHLYI